MKRSGPRTALRTALLKGARASTLRLGLCCTFVAEPIHFRTTTARYLARLGPDKRQQHLRQLIAANARSLGHAIAWCSAHGVAAFRVNSELLPVYTHPQLGYQLEALDPAGALRAALRQAGQGARRGQVRLSFHPDQFVVLNSLRPEVPLVYDVHHHRCNPDDLSEEEATAAAAETWGQREPWVQLSSPKGGWRAERPSSHADYVRLRDLPSCWRGRRQTIDVEAKQKELAVLRLQAAWRRACSAR